MTKTKYFIQFILIIILFGLFKILGIKNSSKLSEFLFVLCGPVFRSKKIIEKNIIISFFSDQMIEFKKKKLWIIMFGKVMEEYFG